jgi:hypothetical protein
MSTRLSKADVKVLLERRDFAALDRWAQSARNPQRILMSLVFERDELSRWRAIEAYARVTAMLDDPEKVRATIRRILWLMNDESGGLAWHGPEMIAEILVRVPGLIPEFADLLPWFLREEPFERGAHYALYRLAAVDREVFRSSANELQSSLEHPDPATRAYAALALETMGVDVHGKATVGQGDQGSFKVYDFDSGQLRETTVARILQSA